ncbi:alkane 1-monooxygenase, partial [Oleiphilus sp. HI0085]
QYEWSWFNFIGGALTAGLAAGIGVNLGHEMGHKVNDRTQVFFAKMALALPGYGHFFIEHNKGHHKDVSTPEDPASSRMGESIYQFVKREVPGAFRRAWELESARLKRQGKSEWSLQNEIIQPALATVALYSMLLAYFGPVMIPFLSIVAAFGYWQLTCANYIEHYGLLRQKNEKTGRFERCQPHHSWNSNQKISNLILLHLQRHSDHHAHPTRAYQVLRDYHGVPSLPAGYPWMFVLAMIPPVWFSVMDPKVVKWAGGDMDKVNIEPTKRDEIFSRHHHPEVEKAA